MTIIQIKDISYVNKFEKMKINIIINTHSAKYYDCQMFKIANWTQMFLVFIQCSIHNGSFYFHFSSHVKYKSHIWIKLHNNSKMYTVSVMLACWTCLCVFVFLEYGEGAFAHIYNAMGTITYRIFVLSPHIEYSTDERAHTNTRTYIQRTQHQFQQHRTEPKNK